MNWSSLILIFCFFCGKDWSRFFMALGFVVFLVEWRRLFLVFWYYSELVKKLLVFYWERVKENLNKFKRNFSKNEKIYL